MSLGTFLAKAWETIKRLFDSMPVELQKAAEISVNVVENIKNFDDKNPEVADILTAIIPGTIDDYIKNWLRSKIPGILTELRLIAWNQLSAEEVTTEAILVLQQLSGDVQKAFLHDLGVLIAQEVARAQAHELTWSDAVYVVEWYYQHKLVKTV